MHNSDRLYLSKFLLNADDDYSFEDDGNQASDYDGETNPYLDGTDFDDMNDYLWD